MALGAACILLLGVGVVAFLAFESEEPREEQQSVKERMAGAIVADITARARTEPDQRSATTVAPPKPYPAVATSTSAPSAPDGYTLVPAAEELPKGRMAASDRRHVFDTVAPGVRDWLGAPAAATQLAASAAAADRHWTFGWIEHQQGFQLADVSVLLGDHDVEVLGTAGNLIRAKLPADLATLSAILEIPGIAAIGTLPPERKLTPSFAATASEAPFAEEVAVFVTLMDDDPKGRWRTALEALGAIVADFDADIRVYAAVTTYGSLPALAAADFVQAIEPIPIVEAAHDTAVPAMGADALRQYDWSTALFSGIGGGSVPIAVMDTGLNIDHLDISSNRSSICGANFVSSVPRSEELGLWVDVHGHGTHVTGTIAGNGSVEPTLAGMAPLVRHVRFAKVLSRFGFGAGDWISRGMDYLSKSTACPEAGWSDESVKPLIVNMSLSAASRAFEGRDASARKLDATVWRHRQLYVVANSNASISGFSQYGAAKNSLAVGAATDSGELAGFSSHGPTRDGRLAPLVVGAGVSLTSPAGNGSRGGYRVLSGTSMSSPAVAGVAALLMDASRSHQGRPALARARLMASAIKPDVWLDDATAFPSDNTAGPGAVQSLYGMGKVSARTSVLNRNRPDGWRNGAGFVVMRDGEYAYRDIVIPEGASRLDLVMTWDEPPADAIANSVLNDLDLWLDEGADCGGVTCGEHRSTSRIDNVEWIIVRNPRPGRYRAKVAANRIYTEAPPAALAWTVIRGDSTPALRLAANQRTLTHAGGDVTLTITSDAYVAAGSRLHVDCSSDEPGACNAVSIPTQEIRTQRADGLVRSGGEGFKYRLSLPLGEVAAGETRTIDMPVGPFRGSHPVRLHFTVDAWNAVATSVAVDVQPQHSEVNASTATKAQPANDGFANAASLVGATGSVDVDLLLSTTEPGEPGSDSFASQSRPHGSVWFEWTAPAAGVYRFATMERRTDGEGNPDVGDVYLGAFTGSQLAGLEHVAMGRWGVVIFAESGTTYRLRVAHTGLTVPMTLQWTEGPRPENDDFAAALPLAGADDGIGGSNLGATLEPGESFGTYAATVWFTWRAPRDGAFQFWANASALRILAFTGNRVGNLRLVSGHPSSSVTFPAEQGQRYRIAVATPNAYTGGRSFALRWQTKDNREAGNDSFSAAEDMGSMGSSSYGVAVNPAATVEPGEPIETGVRTTWYEWTAPEDGRYTWRLGDTSSTELSLAMFEGSSLNRLELIGRTGPGITATEFASDVQGGETYRFALGFAADDSQLYWRASAAATLQWGPTPTNDALANAALLTESRGSVRASNEFATGEREERGGQLGHSSLWWNFEPPTSGWYRFAVTERGFALAIYRNSASGEVGALDLVRSSAGAAPGDPTEVLFYAEAGTHYAVRLGTPSNDPGSEFTVGWEPAEAPVWLRYVGNVAGGDATGNRIEVEGAVLAFDADGARLYAASQSGLQVFERDAATGELSPRHLLGGVDLADAGLVWDATRSRLYTKKSDVWRSYVWSAARRQAEARDVFTVDDDPGHGGELLMDSDGSFFYSVAKNQAITVFAAEAADRFEYVESVSVRALSQAALSNDDSRLYATNNNQLITFERDAATGELTRVDGSEQNLNWAPAMPVAVTDDDQRLFVIDNQGRRTRLFDIGTDPSRPQPLARLAPFWQSTWPWDSPSCQRAGTRPGQRTLDAVCDAAAFAVRAKDGKLEGTDYISPIRSDRFRNPIRDFGPVKSVAFSPDGKHIYLSSRHLGIVILERIGGSLAAEEDSTSLAAAEPSRR